MGFRRQGSYQFGTVRGSGAGSLPCISSADQAEIHACDEAMKAAAQWGMSNIVVETYTSRKQALTKPTPLMMEKATAPMIDP